MRCQSVISNKCFATKHCIYSVFCHNRQVSYDTKAQRRRRSVVEFITNLSSMFIYLESFFWDNSFEVSQGGSEGHCDSSPAISQPLHPKVAHSLKSCLFAQKLLICSKVALLLKSCSSAQNSLIRSKVAHLLEIRSSAQNSLKSRSFSEFL